MQFAFDPTVKATATIRDRYEIQQVIYEDAFRATYLVEDVTSSEACLVQKLTADSVVRAASCYQDAQPKLQRWQALRHPQVQQVKEIFCDGASIFVVQSYVDGQSIGEWLRLRSPLTEAELLQWLSEVLPIVADLHQQGITHGNLSPRSIFVRQVDQRLAFTQCKQLRDLMIQMGITPIEPEFLDRVKPLFTGSLPNGTQEDLYAIALTAILLLTGKELPDLWNAQTQTWDWETYKLVSDGLNQVLARMLSPRPEERFPTADAALQALNQPASAPPIAPSPLYPAATSVPIAPATQQPVYTASQPVSYPSNPVVRPQTTPFQSSESPDQNKGLIIGLGVGIFLTLLGILGVVLSRGNRQPQPVVSFPSSNDSPTGSTNSSNSVINPPNSASTIQSALPSQSALPNPGRSIAPSTLQPNQSPSSTLPNASTPPSGQAPNQIPAAKLTEDEALSLVRNWLQAKRAVFASPFDRQVAEKLTTGALYYDITKPGGSIDWLQENNAYYQFGTQTVSSTGKFSATGDRASIEVNVAEDRTFYVNGKVDQSQSNFKTSKKAYMLQLENGTWKISNYK